MPMSTFLQFVSARQFGHEGHCVASWDLDGRAAVERPQRRDSLTMMPLAAIRSSVASIKFHFPALILSHQFSIHREITGTV